MNRINSIKFLFFLLLPLGLMLTACEPDDPLDEGFVEFRHDANNVDAPFLPAGTYESAARFEADFNGNDDGNTLTEVDYYLKDLPNNATLRIFNGGTTSPSSILYESVLTNEMVSGWNTHTLSEPLRLDGSDLWITFTYTQDSDGRVFGCDAGPSRSDGDWFLDAAVNQWTNFSTATNGDVDINWNIRGQVEVAQ